MHWVFLEGWARKSVAWLSMVFCCICLVWIRLKAAWNQTFPYPSPLYPPPSPIPHPHHPPLWRPHPNSEQRCNTELCSFFCQLNLIQLREGAAPPAKSMHQERKHVWVVFWTDSQPTEQTLQENRGPIPRRTIYTISSLFPCAQAPNHYRLTNNQLLPMKKPWGLILNIENLGKSYKVIHICIQLNTTMKHRA